ncbi:MAG: STAS/SEC14 domain-containing protein [Rudaea sp.]
MLKPIAKLPPRTVGFSAKGEVTTLDYESVLIPAIQSAIKKARNGKIRFLYYLGPGFTGFSLGAMWEDARFGFSHLKAWEKIAVVSDVDWIRIMVNAIKFAIPAPVKVFPNRKLAAAKAWLKD